MMSQLRKKSIGAKFAFSTIRNKVFAQVSSSRYAAYLASSISKSILARMSKTGLISTNNPNINSKFQLWDYSKIRWKKTFDIARSQFIKLISKSLWNFLGCKVHETLHAEFILMVHLHHLAQKVKKNLVMLFLHIALHDIIDINKNFNFSESKNYLAESH